MRLKDKVAIVTGAAKGIGLGIAEVYAQEGANLVLVDWDKESGENSTEEISKTGAESIFLQCDVSSEIQVRNMVASVINAFGRIDILVNNAGIGVLKSVLDASCEDWDHCLSVNLKSVFLCSKYTIPHMQSIGKGVIVNISSVHSHATVKGLAPYAASKGAITALTRNMALDYGPSIRVNSIAPGWIMTPNVQAIFNTYEDPADQRCRIENRQVLKRIGLPRDIGYAAAFLASDEASFITGTQLFVDGGLTAQRETW